MFIVTGAAGFIGSNLVKKLNEIGIDEIVAVDNIYSNKKKIKNLEDARFKDLIDKKVFIDKIKKILSYKKIQTIFHQGACTDTLCIDAKYIFENNYEYSKILLDNSLQKNIKFIYASSASIYGDKIKSIESFQFESPLNLYAYSKFFFDSYVRSLNLNNSHKVVGLRYFNVYGPNESHKKNMASCVFHFNNQLRSGQNLKLFSGSGGFEDGEQKRDFVYVDDVVKVNLWFMKNNISGIYNVGTGKANSFNVLARHIIKWHKNGKIKYIPFPKKLNDCYQHYTKANLNNLRRVGYKDEFSNIGKGVKMYLNNLNKTK